MGRDFRLTALLAARNEGDIVARAVEHLIANRVGVYFIDHESDDDTVARLEPLVGEGLVAIERFPEESPFSPKKAAAAPWESILRREEGLATEIESDWFIRQDADEFLQGPWDGVSLSEAVQRVDELGFNAIEFRVLEFPPVGRPWTGSESLEETFPGWREPADGAGALVRCWKKVDEVDLLSSGGSEADFGRRRVFPVRFTLRHYPIRSQEHGERKTAEAKRSRRGRRRTPMAREVPGARLRSSFRRGRGVADRLRSRRRAPRAA